MDSLHDFCTGALAHEGPTSTFEVIYEVTGPFGRGTLRQGSDGKGHFFQETTAYNGNKDISILDFSKKKMTMLIPRESVAIPTKLPTRRSSTIYDELRAKQLGAKPIGARAVEGHPCHGWKIVNAGITQQIWIGDDTKYMVRSESAGKSSKVIISLKKWSSRPPAASMFEVPANYKVVALSDTPAPIAGMPQGMDVVLRLLKENKPEGAVEELTKLLEKDPKQKSLLAMRGGILYRNLRKNDEALRDFNKVIELDPNWFQGYKRRGEFYTQVKRNDEALSDLNKCISLAPEYGEAYFARAVLLGKTGKIPGGFGRSRQGGKVSLPAYRVDPAIEICVSKSLRKKPIVPKTV